MLNVVSGEYHNVCGSYAIRYSVAYTRHYSVTYVGRCKGNTVCRYNVLLYCVYSADTIQ
jgi:hypothetical protein